MFHIVQGQLKHDITSFGYNITSSLIVHNRFQMWKFKPKIENCIRSVKSALECGSPGI